MEDKNLRLAELLFPNVTDTPEDLEKRFPPRELPEGAKVTRIAPSPTGFVHFGNLFPAFTSERLARLSGGVFLLRIEDTDNQRRVEGAVETIINSFKYYGLEFDEGVTEKGDAGAYGPYSQSQRAHIYHVYAKDLVSRGLAYPCFMTKEELEKIRDRQAELKLLPGVYGKWSKYRDCEFEQIKELAESGVPYVLRLRSPGSEGGRITFTDLVKGKLELDENYVDGVLLKSDGIPTYHFAHAVDDHLMRVTHVVRGEEWLSSLPLHLQLFRLLGFKPPKYLHISLLMKQDGASKRKLSKRHDPEAALTYYRAQGYPADAVREYVMTLLNSNYEEWRMHNPELCYEDFPFAVSKMAKSGSLFDLDKLDDVSKNIICHMTAGRVTELVTDWAREFDRELYLLLSRDLSCAERIFAIGREGSKPRKDLSKWSEVRRYISFFYDELFEREDDFAENVSAADTREILTRYVDIYSPDDNAEIWFEKLKELASDLGYAKTPKEYKAAPDSCKGHVGDISMVLRIAVTGRRTSPDLYCVMQILGRERVKKRLCDALNIIKE